MKLQILINHYNEPSEIVERLLQSIGGQTDVDHKNDYEVIIGSDGTDNQLDAAFLDGFPFNIRYSAFPHRGTRATRNALLDTATADYVMFCDADDCFTEMNGLSTLLKAVESGADVVSVPFYAETKDGDSFRYLRVPNNSIWLHGKIFRRGYLTENAIRFDEIADYGDMCFLWQAFRFTENVRYLSDCFYTWKWNETSVTRAKPFFKVRTYDRMLNAYSRLAENMIARGRDDLRDDVIAQIISGAYVDSQAENWNAAPPEYVSAAKAALSEYIRKWRSVYEAIPERVRKRKYNDTLIMKRTYGPEGGFAGIAAWMEALKSV